MNRVFPVFFFLHIYFSPCFQSEWHLFEHSRRFFCLPVRLSDLPCLSCLGTESITPLKLRHLHSPPLLFSAAWVRTKLIMPPSSEAHWLRREAKAAFGVSPSRDLLHSAREVCSREGGSYYNYFQSEIRACAERKSLLSAKHDTSCFFSMQQLDWLEMIDGGKSSERNNFFSKKF